MSASSTAHGHGSGAALYSSAAGGEEAAVGPAEDVREQDRFLPIANISRIMKRALPPNAKVAKDAKECIQECVSEFISFVTSEASDRCQQEKRKTVSGEDLLWALNSLGFEPYVEPLRLHLAKHREATGKGANASSAGAGLERV